MFKSLVFSSPTANAFLERWAEVSYMAIHRVLGDFQTEPLAVLLPLEEFMKAEGATASFETGKGQIRISADIERQPGAILEKITHELIHGSLDKMPAGDEFFEEGFVDYSTFLMAHLPVWGRYGQAMKDAAIFNIQKRKPTRRWAGGFYASRKYGKNLLSHLREAKKSLTWEEMPR